MAHSPARLAPWMGAALLAGALGGAVTAHAPLERWWPAHPASASAQPRPAPIAAALPDLSAIARDHSAAVVNVTVAGTRRVAWSPDGRPQPRRRGADAADEVVRGVGSGFILDESGVILTNAHVVDGADRVTVKLNDRREFSARVLGSDPLTDIAVLKIDARQLPVVPLGSERDLRVGEWVLAIGSPFGFQNTATVGVVSAKGRTLPDDSLVPYIQTDAAINPGNSGGPLFSAEGKVVGINAQIFSHTGGYEGLSFAIPIDIALKVKDQIMKTGHAQHARLGVAAQDVDQTLAESFGLSSPHGALVAEIEPGSPADKAGLRPGDVILRLGDEPIHEVADLPAAVGQAQPGDRVALALWRERRSLNVTLELTDARAPGQRPTDTAQTRQDTRLGLLIRPLTPREQRAHDGAHGLLIEGVSGAAELAGVEVGDLLVGLNGHPVDSAEQVKAEVQRGGKAFALQLQREGATLFVPLRLG
ncbi:Do family serine endopeptidase [Hydrogenophaga sp.]|uniref:Do family serine endopeptidase n=1 Tax=Hydrogenophaga sp. TaxID=1904254 RepID=UPI0035B44FEA